jgi:acetyl-CoA carboxylase carboxyl transferase subunit alpha
MSIVDEVLTEPRAGAHNDPAQAAAALNNALQTHLNDLRALDTEKHLDTRDERYRHLGSDVEAGTVRS